MPYSYENYADKASTYTGMRRAIGAQEIIDFFGGEKGLAGKKVLDSGCGTGNYSVVLIRDYGVRNMHCSDFSPEMVEEAKKNVAMLTGDVQSQIKDSVTFSTDNICDMSNIPSGEFDFCINNQVVHHFRPENNFADLFSAAKEWYRVLKSGGKLTINFTPSSVQDHGMWWNELIPQAIASWLKLTPSVDIMREALEKAGFSSLEFKPLYEEIVYDPALYFNPKNFLDIENFRRCDSTFNLCTEEEIAAAVARVQGMIEDGTLEEWFKHREEQRKKHGQTMTVYCKKD